MAGEKERQRTLENEVTALRNIHETLSSGAWKLGYDERGEMTPCYWSDTMRRMLGFTSTENFPNEFSAWSDRLHPDDREHTLKEYQDKRLASEPTLRPVTSARSAGSLREFQRSQLWRLLKEISERLASWFPQAQVRQGLWWCLIAVSENYGYGKRGGRFKRTAAQIAHFLRRCSQWKGLLDRSKIAPLKTC